MTSERQKRGNHWKTDRQTDMDIYIYIQTNRLDKIR